MQYYVCSARGNSLRKSKSKESYDLSLFSHLYSHGEFPVIYLYRRTSIIELGEKGLSNTFFIIVIIFFFSFFLFYLFLEAVALPDEAEHLFVRQALLLLRRPRLRPRRTQGRPEVVHLQITHLLISHEEERRAFSFFHSLYLYFFLSFFFLRLEANPRPFTWWRVEASWSLAAKGSVARP